MEGARMEKTFGAVSADGHLRVPVLPFDLWSKRLPSKFREIGPRVVQTPRRIAAAIPALNDNARKESGESASSLRSCPCLKFFAPPLGSLRLCGERT